MWSLLHSRQCCRNYNSLQLCHEANSFKPCSGASSQARAPSYGHCFRRFPIIPQSVPTLSSPLELAVNLNQSETKPWTCPEEGGHVPRNRPLIFTSSPFFVHPSYNHVLPFPSHPSPPPPPPPHTHTHTHTPTPFTSGRASFWVYASLPWFCVQIDFYAYYTQTFALTRPLLSPLPSYCNLMPSVPTLSSPSGPDTNLARRWRPLLLRRPWSLHRQRHLFAWVYPVKPVTKTREKRKTNKQKLTAGKDTKTL